MRRALFILGFLALLTNLAAAQTPSAITNKGRDFWVMFLYNNGDQNPHTTSLIATGDSNAVITVTNPHTNWSSTANLIAGSSVTIVVPNSSSTSNQSGTTATQHLGIHVTSTADISLFADNYRFRCYDATLVLPTASLDYSYILQDYPGDAAHPAVSNAEAGFVATEDNTLLTMVLPCPINNGSYQAGDTITINLSQGESYQIIAASSQSFSGMKVTSNGHPFAAFQGSQAAYIPSGSSGCDLLYEQSIPLSRWGKNHVVVSTANRSGGDQVRITSAENNCAVNINGTLVCTLQAQETYEYHLPANSASRITTTKPVAVFTYLRSTSSGGPLGDPSSVVISPLEQGISHVVFKVADYGELVNHYINIVALTSEVNGIALDGANIAGQFTILDSLYSYTRKVVSTGVHSLSNTTGKFVAWYYGLGDYSSYAYSAGMMLDSINNPEPEIQDTMFYLDTVCQNEAYDGHGFTVSATQTASDGLLESWRSDTVGDTLHHYHLTLTILPASTGDTTALLLLGDTLFYYGDTLTTAGTFTHYLTATNGCDSIVTIHLNFTEYRFIDTVAFVDTVCQNEAYNNHGFVLESSETLTTGTLERWRSDTVGDTLRYCHLTLTVLPLSTSDTTAYIILGDTLFYHGDTLSVAGTYPYHFTAANGCDSLLTLHLHYEALSLTASAEGICPGESVTLTTSGTHYAWWSASPPDTGVDAQQGSTTITVSPSQTTTYNLCAYDGGPVLASVTVGVEAPPELYVRLSRPFIDFDFPVVTFTDCSEGRAHSTWSFSDGIVIENTAARRQFHHPLPDNVEVTLQSCNRYNCCSDTAFYVPSLIRSVWFPNVFTPDEETNNRFGITTSFEIVKFELHIYNRQGLLVYHTEDPAAMWDGTRDGRPCPQGAYVYHWHVRDATDYVKNGTGTITLIR